jgi:hypothetical protein
MRLRHTQRTCRYRFEVGSPYPENNLRARLSEIFAEDEFAEEQLELVHVMHFWDIKTWVGFSLSRLVGDLLATRPMAQVKITALNTYPRHGPIGCG